MLNLHWFDFVGFAGVLLVLGAYFLLGGPLAMRWLGWQGWWGLLGLLSGAMALWVLQAIPSDGVRASA